MGPRGIFCPKNGVMFYILLVGTIGEVWSLWPSAAGEPEPHGKRVCPEDPLKTLVNLHSGCTQRAYLPRSICWESYVCSCATDSLYHLRTDEV
jgi:hypothetical protein